MAKISSLVIPAVIDTSGVDKGISSIKSKLSRVRGGGNGIGGGGTIGGGGNGFSSGVTPLGGSSDIASGMGGSAFGAAFGASAGARLFGRNAWGGYAGMSKTQADSLKSNNFVSRMLTNRAKAAFAERDSYFRGKGNSGLGPEYMGPIMPPQMFDERNQIAQLDRVRNLARIQNLNRKALSYTAMATRFGAGVNKFTSAFAGIKAPNALAGVGAAYAAYEFLDPKNQKARFANSMDFAGTDNYQAMVALRRQAYEPQNQRMSLFQAIDVAAQKGTSGGGPSTLRGIGDFVGKQVENFGEAIGTNFAGPFAQWGRMMGGVGGKTAQQHQRAAEMTYDAIMTGIGNTFKRIFN